MNWIQIKANWEFAKGRVMEAWGELTDDDVTMIDGQYHQLVGRLQERYGYTKEKAEEGIEEFLANFDWKSHTDIDSDLSHNARR